MPLSPTPAQSATSRANGALSRGPATPEGRARSALNGTRHGLAGPFRLLPSEDAAAHERLRAALLARHAPADAAEERWVEELAFAAWRLRRLRALDAAALDAADGTSEPDETARLPSLATLARYRGRIERDQRQALQMLETLRASRPRLPASVASATPAQLRWLADRAERTAEPETGTSEPERHAPAEPEPAAPAAPPPNRQQRRRLAALGRQRPSA